ncbi:MAG: hypothetical protein R3A52_13770 [Polyangiales bacterium]
MTRALVAVSLALLPAVARADPPTTVRFSWVRGDGADACPDERRVRDDVERRLGRDPFSDDATRSIEALVERVDEHWRATIRVRDASGATVGERALTRDDARCDAVVDASALAVALAIDPDAPTDPPPPAPASPRRRPRRSRPAPPAPFTGPWISVALRGAVTAGLTPSVVPSAGLSASVDLSPRWGMRVALDHALAVSADDPRFAFGFTRASIEGCARPWLSTRVDLAACAGVAGALTQAVVRNGSSLDAGESPWIGLATSLAFTVRPTPRWFVSLRVDGAAAVSRGRFNLLPTAGAIYAQPAVAGGAALELGLRAP